MNITYIAYIIVAFLLSTACFKPVYKYDRFKHSRELASLKERFPASNIKMLRELNRNIKKTQRSLRLVISMEKELKRTARNIGSYNWEPETLPVVQNNEEYRNQPFSSWAGKWKAYKTTILYCEYDATIIIDEMNTKMMKNNLLL